MKITKIEEQKKTKGRVNVYVDDEFSFGINANLLVDLDIYKGKEVSPAEIERYKESDNLSKCLSKAYRFLSYRPRSEKEMREKLLEKYDPEIVDEAIEKLREYKYVDDAEFSRIWAESRKSGHSARAISFELQKKGISKEIIESTIESLDKESEYQAAIDLVKNKSKYQNLSKEDAYKKVGGFLSRRGYSYDIIKKVISELY
jgi:regulatory protein